MPGLGILAMARPLAAAIGHRRHPRRPHRVAEMADHRRVGAGPLGRRRPHCARGLVDHARPQPSPATRSLLRSPNRGRRTTQAGARRSRGMRPVIDPRDGDIEDDASSPGRHSLLSLAGSLLAEISFPKLAVASIWLIIMPGLLLGLAPVAASVWFDAVVSKLSAPLAELWPALLLVAIVIGGLIGGRTLLRLAESSFWSLNALAVQPGYMACREGLRHAAERWLPAHATSAQLDRLRAIMAAIAGAIVCALALLVLAAAWPKAHLFGDVGALTSARQLALVTLANSVVIVSGYLAVVALAWGIMDATIAQPRDLGGYFAPPAAG